MGNRFRNPVLRGQYDAMVRAFHTKHPDLIREGGRRCTGNAWANYFWAGYDGLTVGRGNFSSDRNARQTPAYACYRAGQDCKRGQ